MAESKINIKKLNRSSWKTYRFEEIASKITESVNPGETDLDIYVGLEHLDAEDIHIRRKGTPSDVKGNKLKCYPGDIIFGKRRAYQRKAAIVDFEGICSAHAFIFRANDEVIDPKLFPFFLHSDQFMHRAVDISVGGLSPTINWGDLKGQEFLLPPKEEQARLAELLWSLDEVIERDEILSKSIYKFYNSRREVLLNKELSGEKKRLGDLSKLQGGATFKSLDSVDKGVPWLKIANVGFHEIKWDDASFLPEKFTSKYPDFVLYEGDIIIALTRPILGDRLKVAQVNSENEGALLNQRVGRVQILDDSIISEYMYEHLKSNSFMLAMKRELQGTDPPNISNKMFENYEITLPSIQEQEEIKKELVSIYDNFLLSKEKTNHSKSLQKNLINEIFG